MEHRRAVVSVVEVMLPLLAIEPVHARAVLRTEVSQAVAGKPFLAAVEISTDPHWHVYWRNPGDSGIPTKIEWQAPKGWTVKPLEMPTPKRFTMGGNGAFVYDGKVLFLAQVTAKGSGVLKAKAKWLVCNDSCIPGGGTPSVMVRVGPTTKPVLGGVTLRKAQAALPRPAPAGWQFRAGQSAKGVFFVASPPPGGTLPLGTPSFFPLDSGIVDHATPALATFQGGKVVLQMKVSPFPEEHATLAGLLVAPPGKKWPGGQSALIVEARLEKGRTR